MNQTLLFEDHKWSQLLPLTWWRSVFELRAGRKILLDRIAQTTQTAITGVWVREWIADVAAHRCSFPANAALSAPALLVNGRWLPEGPIGDGDGPVVFVCGDDVAAVVLDEDRAKRASARVMLDPAASDELLEGLPRREISGAMIRYPWDLVTALPSLLEEDWQPSDAAIAGEVDARSIFGDSSALHCGERSVIHPSAVLDVRSGPVFISHDVNVGACAVIEGPAYIGPGTAIRPHAHLHGGCAIGPVCKIGGEIDATIVQGYSNKQHHGFLGHAYVGSWVNIGAGATNSDLKNTYGNVRASVCRASVDTGTPFFGATIGDHAKIGIQAAIPTGASVGFAASIATTDLAPRFVPSFTWISRGEEQTGDAAKLKEIARAMAARRSVEFTDAELALFDHIANVSKDVETIAQA